MACSCVSEPSGSFSVVLLTTGSTSFEVVGLLPSDTTASLHTKAAELTGICQGFLKLAVGDQIISASSSTSLFVAGLRPGSFVTAVHSVHPQVFWRGYEIRRDYEWNWAECESHERVLLDFDASCFFVGLDRTQTEWSMDENDVLQWDVLQGTYKLQGDVALCEWNRHLHRKFNRTSGQVDDSCWEEKDPRASVKWQRIRLPGNIDDRKFRALIADAAAKDGSDIDLATLDWFHQQASARCREWPAASFGVGLVETYTPYWHSIGAMSSEHATIPARALHKLIAKEDIVTARESNPQTAESEAMKEGLWKCVMKPMRLDAVWEDGFAHPAMDAVKAVGLWRRLDEASTLSMLENGLESHRAVDVENSCLLGIPLLCPGGVVQDGEEPRAPRKAGGAWIETQGTATAKGMLSELLAALKSEQGPICGELSLEKLRERGLGRYHFVRDDEGKGKGKGKSGRELIRVDKIDGDELANGDVILVTAPFTTANWENNVEVQEGNEGTVMEIADGWIKVEFLDHESSPDQTYWIDAVGMESMQKKVTQEKRLALAWIQAQEVSSRARVNNF